MERQLAKERAAGEPLDWWWWCWLLGRPLPLTAHVLASPTSP